MKKEITFDEAHEYLGECFKAHLEAKNKGAEAEKEIIRTRNVLRDAQEQLRGITKDLLNY